MVSLKRWFRGNRGTRPHRKRNRLRPDVEGLETRVVLYSATGNAWPNPQLITISFMPDGTSLGGGKTSNLFSAFNGNSNLAGKWQNVILQAAQTWAQQTNINFAVVPDDGSPEGSSPDEQGYSGFGDIRIGGYNFGCSTLALTYQPPQANNFSLAGDVTFNTGQGFHINSTYDLFTVATHEIGHALGLGESSVGGSVMYGTYNGVMKGLASDDIAGIRAIYSGNAARTPDTYNVNSNNNASENMATWLNAVINYNTLTALVPNLDITTAGQAEYFAFPAPYGGTGTLKLDVQSSGLSLLAPKVTVYSSNGTTVLASANGAGQYGTTLNVTVPNLVVGQSYYIEVQGADNTQMGTGRYALGLNFNGAAPPTEASPIVAEPNGNPQHAGSGQADGSNGTGPYVSALPVITGISPDNGISSQDGITNTPNISIHGTAPASDTVTIYCNGQAIGQTIAQTNNTFSYNPSNLSESVYQFTAMAADSSGYSTPVSYPYQVTIDTHVPAPPVLNDITPDTGASSTDGITNAKNPTFSGQSEPFAYINLYSNGSNQPFATTEADINGNWSYAISGGGWGDGTYKVTVAAMDIAGSVSSVSGALTVVIDTQQPQQPVVTGISPDTGTAGDMITNSQQLNFNGTAPTGTTVQLFLNGSAVGTAATNNNGAWSFDDTGTTLAAGSYTVTAIATDVAGNASQPSQPRTVVIDLTPPPVPIIVGLSPDTGRSVTDWVTSNNQKPTISGTTIGNGIVTVYCNGALLGQATAQGNGQWSFTDPSSYHDGAYAYTATVTDYVGNVSAASAARTMVVDTTAPAAPAIAGFSPDSGVVGDGITNCKNPTLVGTAEPTSAVSIYQSGQGGSIGSALADANGNWSFPIPGGGLGDGRYQYTAQATDAAGNTGPSSQPLSLTIDTTAPQAPVVTGISPDTGLVTTDGVTDRPRLVFNGTAEANSVVAVYLNGVLAGTAAAGNNGAWSFDNTAVALADGVYSVTATATDAAGNTGQASHVYTVTVNTVPPAVPSIATIGTFWGTSGNGALTNANKPTFTGTTIPGGIINFYAGSTLLGTATATSDHGVWSLTSSVTLTDGSYAATATVTDYVGNVSAASSPFQFTLDSTAPSLPAILSISPDTGVSNTDGITNVNTPTFSGTAEPGSTVKVFTGQTVFGSAVADGNGNWSLAVTKSIGDGSYNVQATATDPAGNTSQNSASFQLTIITQITDPKATGISPDTGLHNNDDITDARNIILNGTSGPNATITVYQNGFQIGTTTANSSGSWTYDNRAVSLSDGTYTFTFAASDAAGNVSAHPATLNVTIDTVACSPVIAGVNKSVNGSGTPILVISGTAEAGGQVNLMAGGASIGTVNADGHGNWQFNYLYNTAATSYSFTGVTTDVAGNISPVSTAFNLLLKGAPTASGLQVAASSILGVDGSGTPQTINTPTITGKATAGSVVTIVDGNTILGTVVADSKGNWNFLCPVLAKGKHTIAAEASNATGAYGLLSNSLTFNV